MGKYGDYGDPAHDAEMDELRRQQLCDDISAEDAAAECAYLDDWFDEPDPEPYWLDEDDIVLVDDEEDRYWVVIHHQPRS